ncbi:MAG: hypothetical protein RJB31_31 [Bacteroidota bacterium]|jgi:hypothetical protein
MQTELFHKILQINILILFRITDMVFKGDIFYITEVKK